LNGAWRFTPADKVFPGIGFKYPIAVADLLPNPPIYDRARMLAEAVSKRLRNTLDELLVRSPHARVGLIVATSHGEAGAATHVAETFRRNPASPDFFSNAAASRVLEEDLLAPVCAALGRELPGQIVAAACASGAVAVGLAYERILRGRVDAYVIVSVDPIARVAVAGFKQFGVLSENGCRPFSAQRDGTTVAEGAAGVVLCAAEVAPLGSFPTVKSFNHNCSGNHPVEPSLDGVVRSMSGAIFTSGYRLEDFAAVYLHGTGTRSNDETEAAAMTRVFGLARPPVTSIKGSTGHTMGSAAMISLTMAARSMRQRMLPATRTDDCEYESIDLVVGHARPLVRGPILINGIGFGGLNASLVISPADDS
jgi:3-oxoacyl-(acyl-carrier-protein) synthase